jgi:hypothetical protein
MLSPSGSAPARKSSLTLSQFPDRQAARKSSAMTARMTKEKTKKKGHSSISNLKVSKSIFGESGSTKASKSAQTGATKEEFQILPREG